MSEIFTLCLTAAKTGGILLTPLALRYPTATAIEWREHRYQAIACALLIPLAHTMVLTAMQFTPVSYVTPAREISILIGTVMGARLLGEADVGRRLAAAGAMVVGLVALAFG